MQVTIELDDEQVDDVLLKALTDGFEINLNFKNEPEFEAINNAFLTLIRYYSTESQLEKFVISLPKNIRTESARRLAEAYNGH